jgi:hypothetical protein
VNEKRDSNIKYHGREPFENNEWGNVTFLGVHGSPVHGHVLYFYRTECRTNKWNNGTTKLKVDERKCKDHER